MAPDEFIANVILEMEHLALSFRGELDGGVKTKVAALVESLQLDDEQEKLLFEILRMTTEDTIYSFICALEGHVPLGDIQQKFKLLDESGNELTGELDRLFYERLLDEDVLD
jgi:hypothetical protein